ncbi:bacterial regulatory s, tetR family protein [Mycolicibacterium hassiacum DSM 44199]|uniref:Bacterial regulatory s, tetR family protein n=1 Tax=Mycolicibacterium hassiacum (strain DSM 44199 / CIP 105218 / JCM 12690 / 3849) TaxID=1122247 RepID=K5BKT4_MYCHD|nr:bacterial regulatory s, tetR family protein [Mycolicibacterium hassiacum DSM 44199]MBX5485291.1 TetR family transcriptional regulator [Mycolicibacterium hassiacum]MDA4086127.1 TetR family transcriptional regulator [Mycolicibacterium hassiacum DSM 44199]PZN23988.1 MAG: TetR/AcrR family transcriptional regulator [Mycolicibacterium hassiacum]VCT92945.1 hypothetical protein MHAS_04682 [Mycolicibacterium hassiacum DSM 44199]
MSREAVLAAAKARFATDGYDKTTLRAIAEDAHVDPAMVLYLFGSKAELFRAVLNVVIDPQVLVAALAGAGDDEPDVGVRMVRSYLRIWESPDTGPAMAAMLQSATSNPDAHEAFRGFIQGYVLQTVSGVLGGDEQARLRATLAASQLVGMAVLRYVMRIGPLAELSHAELERLLAPTVRRYLTADAAELGLPQRSSDGGEVVNPLVQHHDSDHHQDPGD